jgi:hypothetical protein
MKKQLKVQMSNRTESSPYNVTLLVQIGTDIKKTRHIVYLLTLKGLKRAIRTFGMAYQNDKSLKIDAYNHIIKHTCAEDRPSDNNLFISVLTYISCHKELYMIYNENSQDSLHLSLNIFINDESLTNIESLDIETYKSIRESVNKFSNN